MRSVQRASIIAEHMKSNYFQKFNKLKLFSKYILNNVQNEIALEKMVMNGFYLEWEDKYTYTSTKNGLLNKFILP